jgi:hypothetical protein
MAILLSPEKMPTWSLVATMPAFGSNAGDLWQLRQRLLEATSPDYASGLW